MNDIYQTETPFGPVAVTFPEEGGITFSGNAAAVDHLKTVIAEQTDGEGYSLTVETIEPADFYYFCQPQGSGVTITPPEGGFDDDDTALAIDELRRVRDVALNNEPINRAAGNVEQAELERQTAESVAAAINTLESKQMGIFDSAAPALVELRGALKAADGIMAKLVVMRDMIRAVAAGPQAEEAHAAPRRPTAHFYEFDQDRKHAQRKRDNAAAMTLLEQIDAGEVDGNSLSAMQKQTLAKYSGTGGALIGADGKKGSAYEYYTPAPIAAGIYDLLQELGFSGGKILDPCAGTGIFGATAPESAIVDAVELNETSGRVNGLVNNGPGYTTTISPFEAVAANTPDEIYDAVVTNVPFSNNINDRGGNNTKDNRYQNQPIENYFVLRSLEKLKPGGLAAFITPPRCVSGKGGKQTDLRIKASYMAEFLGAYRLPNLVFGTADADTMTDVIVFRKFNRETLDKIAELREQSPETLISAGVQWTPFIEGKYFDTEGRRFVLGDYGTAKGKFGDVTVLNSQLSVRDIAKLMRKFPDSHINWDALGAAETTPIIYKDGDTLTQAGETLQMVDGRWIPLKRNEGNAELSQLAGKLKDPYSAFENDVPWGGAEKCVNYMIEMGQALDVPSWLRGAVDQLHKVKDEGERAQCWTAGVVGMAVDQVLAERLSGEVGVKFIDEYAALSEAMRRAAAAAKARPSVIGGGVRKGMQALCTHYSKKSGYSAVWRGDVQAEVENDLVTADGTFEGLRYKTKSAWVGLGDAKAIFGDDFDPLEDSDWCVSADGTQVTRADDYYVGNYAEFLKRIDADIAQATSESVKAKLLRQKLDASARIDRVDVSQMTFNLSSPHVSMEDKINFLRRYVHESAVLIYDEKTGDKRVGLDVPTSKDYENDKGKLLRRFDQYLKNGTITLGGAQTDMPKADALRELRKMVNTANEQFNNWVRSNSDITKKLEAIADDPEKLRFRSVEDESPLNVPGLAPGFTPHGFQNAEIRRQSREFGGINGFGVGLGKTFTSLTAVQYAQSIGVKKKTAFIVPNSVLSNWRKEAGRAFVSTEDCLFIGLRTNKAGKAVVQSSAYDEDLLRVMENRHAKIFMTMEAFERIRLRDETITAYETYLRRVDSSFAESEDKKEDERNKGKQAGLLDPLRNKSGSAPFMEDLGIDSLVFDEAHMFKNSADTVNFKNAKYLSLSDSSGRGVDAQAKAWYVRGQSPMKDGVMLLTATPITNSPLEIYAMLSLSVGHDRVNDMCLGIKGADDFMEMMCRKVNEDDVTMDGVARTTDVFVGLNNVEVLRKAINGVANIKDAEQVGEQVVIPDRADKATPITLTPDIIKRLQTYKGAFRYAIDEISGKDENRGDPAAYDEVERDFGEPMSLIGHPFNLINKMTLLIADPELDKRATFYSFPAAQEAVAKKVVDQFNAKKYAEDRPRPSPMTAPDAVISTKTKKNDEGDIETILKIHVRAKIADGRIVIDTMASEQQSAFEAMADKAGLDLDVSVPPKLAALLENFQNEQANPRGVDDEGKKLPIVKQIIFCDVLALHNKIKRILTKRAGVPAGAIAIITGKSNNKPDEILAVQDGFNSNGEDNKYRVIIANEKAEVGINLQKGTQAIHHMTIGWTPDSLEQRNGRGARQGNKTAYLNIYHYDADGTFDSSKRTMVNKKADWISRVTDVGGSGSVDVEGGLSNEQIEALIDAVGDADAVKRMQETLAAKEAEKRAADNRDRQMIQIETIRKQNEFLEKNKSADEFVIRKVSGLFVLEKQARMLRARIQNPTATATAVAKNQALLAELEGTIAGVRRVLDKSAVFYTKHFNSLSRQYEEAPAQMDHFFNIMRGERQQKPEDVEEALRTASYKTQYISVRAVEGEQIFNDWQSEVDLAKSMIDEAKVSYVKQAGNKGALPAAVVDEFAQGGGMVFYGKPVVKSAFFKTTSGAIGVISSQTNTVKFASEKGLGHMETMLIADAVKTTEMIYPGTAGYDACLTQAAKLEDAESVNGVVMNVYSDAIPEVAQRRTTDILATYYSGNYKLPSPHYPYVITERERDKTPVQAHIFAAQAKVIRKLDGGYFTLPNTVAVERRTDADTKAERPALVEYAKAHGLRLTVNDFLIEMYVKEEVAKQVSLDDFKAALTGESEEVLRKQAADFLREKVTWFDYAEMDPLNYDFIPYAMLSAMKDAIAVANLKNPPAVAEVEAVVQQTESGGSPDDVVGIKGNTKPWFNTIKQCANRVGKGKYKWDGRAGVWNVLRSTWDYLVENHPNAAKELQLTEKTRYSI